MKLAILYTLLVPTACCLTLTASGIIPSSQKHSHRFSETITQTPKEPSANRLQDDHYAHSHAKPFASRAMISLSSSGTFYIDPGKQGCILTHKNLDQTDYITLALRDQAEEQTGSQNAMRIEMTYGSHSSHHIRYINGENIYATLTPSDITLLHAEKRYKKTSDREYKDINKEARALHENAETISNISIHVNNDTLAGYTARMESAKYIPYNRIEPVNLEVLNAPALLEQAGTDMEYATINYAGPCKIAFLVE